MNPNAGSKAGTILSRAQRDGRGSDMEKIMAEGLKLDDDLADFFNVMTKKNKKKPSITTAKTEARKKKTKADDDDNGDGKEKVESKNKNNSEIQEEKEKESSSSSPSSEVDEDEDDDDDDIDEDDDSTFSASDISKLSSDKLDSDFGDDESTDYDSDAGEVMDDKAIRREERAATRKERGRMERVMQGGNSNANTNKNTTTSSKKNASASNDPSSTNALQLRRMKASGESNVQQLRMQAAREWAVKQTAALQQKEALYNDAERIVKERAMLAIAKRRKLKNIQNAGSLTSLPKRRQRNDQVDEDADLQEDLSAPPVYISNMKLLEETGFPSVMIYPKGYTFFCNFAAENPKDENKDVTHMMMNMMMQVSSNNKSKK